MGAPESPEADGAGVAADAASSHDLTAERALLGAVLLDPHRIREVRATGLRPDDFFRAAHSLIFAAMLRLDDRGVAPDVVMLQDELGRRQWDQVGGSLYFSGLIDGITRASNVAAYSEIVTGHARTRHVLAVLRSAEDEICRDGAVTIGAISTLEALVVAGPAEAGQTHERRVAVETAAERARRAARRRVDAEERGGGDPPAFVPADALMVEAPPVPIVEGVVWPGAVTLFVAASGAGKTFAALSIAAAIVDGVSWCGRRVRRGSAAILAYEADALGLRCRALAEVHRRTLRGLFFLKAAAPLSPRIGRDGAEAPAQGEIETAAALRDLASSLEATGLPPLALVIIDTARLAFAGSEDSSGDVSAFIRAVRRILAAAAPGAAVLLVHHAGWQDGDADTRRRRERGSSAWRGNVDATLFLEAGEFDVERRQMPLTLSTLKARDAAPAPPLHLVRRSVTLSTYDEHGRPHTSCVVEADPRSQAEREAAEAAASVAESRARLVEVLRHVDAHPDQAVTLDTIREGLGIRKQELAALVGNLKDLGYLAKGGRGEPYRVTSAGRGFMAGYPRRADGGNGSRSGLGTVPGTVPTGSRRGPAGSSSGSALKGRNPEPLGTAGDDENPERDPELDLGDGFARF